MFRVTGICEGNSPVTSGFPAQRASNAENVSIWWRHHGPTSRRSGSAIKRELIWILQHVFWWFIAKFYFRNTGGNRTMVTAATIVSMATAKKAQQNVFALYHSYNRTILLGFIWILDFHFKIVLVLRRRYLIPIRCNNGKGKMWPWRWLHHFDFQHWRWLHALMTMVVLFRAGNFWHTHSRSPADK